MRKIINQELIDLIKNKDLITDLDNISPFEEKVSRTYVRDSLTEIDVRLSGWIRRERGPHSVDCVIHEAYPDNWDHVWDHETYVDLSEDEMIYLKPGEMILGKTYETFNIPPDIIGQFSLRSWAARSGLNHSTSLQMKPNWAGQLVLELHNCLTDRWLAFKPLSEIGQVEFYRINESLPERAWRKLKYGSGNKINEPVKWPRS